MNTDTNKVSASVQAHHSDSYHNGTASDAHVPIQVAFGILCGRRRPHVAGSEVSEETSAIDYKRTFRKISQDRWLKKL